MKHFKYISLILLSLFLMGCPDKDEEMDSEIIVINSSDKSLILSENNVNYPDTSIWWGSNPFDKVIRERFTIKPNSIYKQKTNWRSAFMHSGSSEVMMIYLFDTSVLDTVSWEIIKEDYLVAKRYDLTLKQLDSLNWTITYP